jgi:hypothetical protein
VTKVHLQRAGLVVRAPKRSAHRKKRPRRPMIGMMLHQSLPRERCSPWLGDDMTRRSNEDPLRPGLRPIGEH